MNYKLYKILSIAAGLILITVSVLLVSCDSRRLYTNPTTPIDSNQYGAGNGKITFFRTQPIAGPVTIKISNESITDSIVWQSPPLCDSNISTSKILRAGDYFVSIEGAVFLCNYNVRVEERICKIIDYTNCSNGYIGCYSLNGTWLRTADGPCPNCEGLKIQFSNGIGEVIYTPPGCRFPLWDIKWKDFNFSNCTLLDIARDQYGGTPEYQSANITFFNKDSLIINGPSGIIPYSRISNTNVKVNRKNTNHIEHLPAYDKSAELLLGR